MSTIASRADATRAIQQSGPGLFWTEWLYLAAVTVAAFVAVDPLEMDLAGERELRHVPLALVVPLVLITLLGGRLRVNWRKAWSAMSPSALLWPLIALAVLVIAGGTYARFFQGIQNSFLNYGLYMFAAYFAAAMVWRSDDPEALARAYLRVILVAAFIMAGYLIANYGGRQVYHEQIFLVIPFAVYFFMRRDGAATRWVGCTFFLAMAWLSAKYTSYLIGVMSIAYAVFIIAVPRMAPAPGLKRTMLVYWALLAGGLLAAVLGMLAISGAFDLPTGNVEYRTHTYQLAWDRFLESPLWGTLFTVEAVEKFTLYSINNSNMLATHSDVLDLLANGGLLGVFLWLYAHLRVARIAWANLLHPRMLDRSWAPYAHAMAVIAFAGIVTYTFNPIMLQPGMAFLLWTNFGMLAGLALVEAPGGEGSRR